MPSSLIYIKLILIYGRGTFFNFIKSKQAAAMGCLLLI